MAQPDQPDTPLLVDVRRAARLMSCGEKTFKGLVKRGLIRFVLLGERTMRFDPADLRQAVEAMKQCVSTDAPVRRLCGSTSPSRAVGVFDAARARLTKPKLR